MDAILKDMNGNRKNFLYQYDEGQYIEIEKFEYDNAPCVHFSIKSLEMAVSVPSTLNKGTLTIKIPDILLTYGEDITAHLYCQYDDDISEVVDVIFISVKPRKKPFQHVDFKILIDNRNVIGLIQDNIRLRDLENDMLYSLWMRNGEWVIEPTIELMNYEGDV